MSSKSIMIEFFNNCDTNNILYSSGFKQRVFLSQCIDVPVIENTETVKLDGFGDEIIKNRRTIERQAFEAFGISDAQLFAFHSIRGQSNITITYLESGETFEMKNFDFSSRVAADQCLNIGRFLFECGRQILTACCVNLLGDPVCNNNPVITGELTQGDTCLQLSVSGSESPIDTSSIEWSNDGGDTWQVGDLICGCDLVVEATFEALCSNVGAFGVALETNISIDCTGLGATVVQTIKDEDGSVSVNNGIPSAVEIFANGNVFDNNTGGWREYMYEITFPNGDLIRCTARYTHTNNLGNLNCGDNLITTINPNGNDTDKTLFRTILARATVTYTDGCPDTIIDPVQVWPV